MKINQNQTRWTAILTIIMLVFINGEGYSQEKTKRLLIRLDDIGMCHAVNEGAEHIFASGLPVSASVMWACPWSFLMVNHPGWKSAEMDALTLDANDKKGSITDGRLRVSEVISSAAFREKLQKRGIFAITYRDLMNSGSKAQDK